MVLDITRKCLTPMIMLIKNKRNRRLADIKIMKVYCCSGVRRTERDITAGKCTTCTTAYNKTAIQDNNQYTLYCTLLNMKVVHCDSCDLMMCSPSIHHLGFSSNISFIRPALSPHIVAFTGSPAQEFGVPNISF